MANDNTNNNNPPIADESGVVKVWTFKQNADGSLSPASSGGVSNAVDISDTNGDALLSNGSGALQVAVVSGGGSNPSVGTTGSAAPTSATEIGTIDGSGKLQGASSSNPVPVAVISGGGSNPSVGTNGAAIPTSSTLIGGSDGADLQPLLVDGSGNLKVITDSGSVTGATLSAETTKVIGTVRNADGAGNLWTSNSTTYSGKFAQDVNILGTLGTAFTTAGLVDIKGTDGNVFVRSNAASTFPVLASIVGHAGVTLDAVLGATKPANVLQVGGNDGTNAYAIPLASGGASVVTSGTSTVTPSGIFEVSPTGAANTKTNPFFTEISDGTNTVTTNSTTYTSKYGLDVNLLGTLGTAFTTAGLVDIKGTDGNVFVRQTTAANLNATVVQGTAAANTAGWPVTSGGLAESTAAWTSATTVNSAVTVNTVGYSTVVVTLNQGTTLTGGVITFEVSDTTGFTNAYPISAIKPNSLNASSVIATYNFVASTNQSFVVNLAGYAAFRVRLSTVISGSGTVNVGVSTTAVTSGYSTGLQAFQTAALEVSSTLAAAAPADNIASTNFFASSGNAADPLYAASAVYGGAFSGTASAALQGWSKRRTPTVFKTVQATASGNTAVWTPATGNKFRLLKLFVEVTDNASLASGGVLTINFQDATTSINISFDVFVPTTAVTTVIGDGLEQQLDLGEFGILSAAANNVLNVNLSSALATGNCRVIAMGTEE